jgi:hypothetical protein
MEEAGLSHAIHCLFPFDAVPARFDDFQHILPWRVGGRDIPVILNSLHKSAAFVSF